MHLHDKNITEGIPVLHIGHGDLNTVSQVENLPDVRVRLTDVTTFRLQLGPKPQ